MYYWIDVKVRCPKHTVILCWCKNRGNNWKKAMYWVSSELLNEHYRKDQIYCTQKRTRFLFLDLDTRFKARYFQNSLTWPKTWTLSFLFSDCLLPPTLFLMLLSPLPQLLPPPTLSPTQLSPKQLPPPTLLSMVLSKAMLSAFLKPLTC